MFYSPELSTDTIVSQYYHVCSVGKLRDGETWSEPIGLLKQGLCLSQMYAIQLHLQTCVVVDADDDNDNDTINQSIIIITLK